MTVEFPLSQFFVPLNILLVHFKQNSSFEPFEVARIIPWGFSLRDYFPNRTANLHQAWYKLAESRDWAETKYGQVSTLKFKNGFSEMREFAWIIKRPCPSPGLGFEFRVLSRHSWKVEDLPLFYPDILVKWCNYLLRLVCWTNRTWYNIFLGCQSYWLVGLHQYVWQRSVRLLDLCFFFKLIGLKAKQVLKINLCL